MRWKIKSEPETILGAKSSREDAAVAAGGGSVGIAGVTPGRGQ